MTTENNNNLTERRKSLDENKVLLVAILAPVVLVVSIILVMAGGPAIVKAIKLIFAAIFPNFWVVLIYAYILLIGWIAGRKSKKWKLEDVNWHPRFLFMVLLIKNEVKTSKNVLTYTCENDIMVTASVNTKKWYFRSGLFLNLRRWNLSANN